MAENTPELIKLTPIASPLSLVPVNLKEAALDSPSFRATTVHFGEQIDAVERWLEGYTRAAGRLANEVTSIESLVNSYIASALPPPAISEAAIDHDYTLLALQRYNEGSREFWTSTIKWMKKVESTVIDPIKSFLQHDLASLKVLRRTLEYAQKHFDTTVARYASQSRTKESSSLREDAFQLHEARKAYLKASMDFCVAAPQVRASLDKLLVKVFSDRWREMKNSRDTLASSMANWTTDVYRVRGWSKEMENQERVFAHELQVARRQIEEVAETKARPSRDLNSYSISAVPHLNSTSGALASPTKQGIGLSEKQGWLFQRTLVGKPTRTVWTRRWFYVKNGVFGWLAQSAQLSAVEESEKIGVLLCGVRTANQEERRFCFEVKTKDSTIILQAETQPDLTEWIAAFEVVKRRALENPTETRGLAGPGIQGAPFAITAPIAPEFAARVAEHQSDEAGAERASTLGTDHGSLPRASTDLRRTGEYGEESSKRERVLQKLDLHRKIGSQSSSGAVGAIGGIASLIAASHSALPISPSVTTSPPVAGPDYRKLFGAAIPISSLAPSTFANPPTPTTLSRTALVIGAERGLRLSEAGDGGLPGGLMANLWGSTNWGHVNRLERSNLSQHGRTISSNHGALDPNPARVVERAETPSLIEPTKSMPHLEHVMSAPANSQILSQQGVNSGDANALLPSIVEDYPDYYPASLKSQDIQFRMLFPNAIKDDRLVLVFRATWNPSDQQEFPGRIYVTTKELYFYSNHLGLVLITGLHLSSIAEITAAPGRDSDFLFIHLKDGITADGSTRAAIKIFLEPLKLLRRRLELLVNNAQSSQPLPLAEVIKALIRLETKDQPEDSPMIDKWEDSGDAAGYQAAPRHGRGGQDVKIGLHIDGSIYVDPMRRIPKNATKFRLPAQPVEFVPQGFKLPIIERQYDVTAKSLFHVLAGDKSAVFQILYCQRGATQLVQGPWLQPENGHHRREIRYETKHTDPPVVVSDYQVIDVMNDHLCYVITERKTAWFLPRFNSFTLVLKVIVTHVSKSHCKLALFGRVEWTTTPLIGKGLIDHQANAFLQSYAGSLMDIVTDQASRLGVQGSTSARKSVNVFGGIGEQTEAVQLNASDLAPADLKGTKRMVHRSLPRLILYASRRMVITYSFFLLGQLLHLMKWSYGIMTANRVLILVLFSSMLLNMFHASRDSWVWWTERRAGKYMKRLGVQPDAVMSRSIWLKDMNHVVAEAHPNHTTIVTGNGQCQSAFTKVLDSLDPSGAAISLGQEMHITKTTESMLKRITRSRQHFGSYRHDLLVALRLIGTVEKEVVKAEWENWVMTESSRCKHAESLLHKGGNTAAFREWWNEYCVSCLGAMKELRNDATISV